MFLFPYRAQIKLHKWPVMTIAVAVVCLVIYFIQFQNEKRVETYTANFCERQLAAAAAEEGDDETAGESRYSARSQASCEHAMLTLYYSTDPERRLAKWIIELKSSGNEIGAARLSRAYRDFAARAPAAITTRLWHDRSRFDPIGMITSSFAHGSWDHVIFNLIFFFAFAAAVELVLGPILFLGSILLLSLCIGSFDYAIATWEGSALPSLGLSGVVMGMLAMFVYFLPRARIRMFFWFMLSVGTIGIPAWIIATWYIGWDLYSQLSGEGGYINFIAHLAGAAFGFIIGFVFFRRKRHWAKELVLESNSPDLTKDEGALSKFNSIMVAPVVAGFALVSGVLLITLIVSLVERFWVAMLLAAPAALAMYQLYNSRREERRPQRDHLQRAVDAIEKFEYATAKKLLEPLAQKNDTRALFALAGLHAAGKGVPRNDIKAAQLYISASQRGHAQSLFILASLYADGRGIPRDMTKAIECYEKAAQAGLPDAANSLGYLYQTGTGIPANPEKAIDWYIRAGIGYQKAKRVDDLKAIVRQLESFVAKFPKTQEALMKLKAAI